MTPLDEPARAQYVRRIQDYMVKAIREAKVNTSWLNPNTAYDDAVRSFIAAILEDAPDNRFLADFRSLQRTIAHFGAFNSLAQTLLKLAAPGVPDIYQGTELWDFSLVDPDNRRPVDYAVRARLLAEHEEHRPPAAELLANLADGRAKLHVIRQGLAVRKTHAALFHGGRYTPIYADSGYEENVIAFSLEFGGRAVVAIAPRLFARKLGDGAAPVGAFWAEARVALPGGAYVDVMTQRGHNGGSARMADLLAEFPVALLVRR